MGTNKDDEEWTLSLLKTHHPDIFSFDTKASEEPDFLSTDLPGITGIELTRFYWPESSKIGTPARESHLTKISAACEQLSKDRGLSGIGVSVFIPLERLAGARDVDRIAHELVNFVIANMPPAGLDDESSTFINPDLNFDAIQRIRISRLPKLASPFWTFPRAGWAPRICSNDIQPVVLKKERLLASYRQRCDAVWLVITTGAGGLASQCDIFTENLADPIKTGFDRCFLFERPSTRLFELSR